MERKEPTGSQKPIAEAIIHSKDQRMTLAGLAGTGKTTVARHIHDSWVDMGLKVVVMGPTGKSTVVLQNKGVPAITIHKGIYQFKGKFQNMRGETELVFKDNQKGKFCDRFIVDESSMLTLRQVEDIEKRGTQVLFVGDPGQLPPVKSKANGLFNKSSHILREIHRQAADSPIIKWAHTLRKGAALTTRFEGIDHVEVRNGCPVAVASEMLDRKVDRLIVHSNRQRVALNRAYRGVIGRRGIVDVGEEIICLMNNKLLDVVNGQIFRVTKILGQHRDYTRIVAVDIDSNYSEVFSVWNAQFGEERKLEDEEGNDVDQEFMLADYAYAITCHKMQGSSCRHAGIAARGFSEEERKWNYTAATRAEEKITVFC